MIILKQHKWIRLIAMYNKTKYLCITAIAVTLALLQSQAALAMSKDRIQIEIESRIAATEQLEDAQIEVHLYENLVILTGEVRLYEQKLVGERLAWTTPGVFEVDNELRVVPRTPLTDSAIAQRIADIVSRQDRFRVANVVTNVHEGRVRLHGSFVGYSDPTDLKHQIAEIEGVIEINISARFLARLGDKPVSVNVD